MLFDVAAPAGAGARGGRGNPGQRHIVRKVLGGGWGDSDREDDDEEGVAVVDDLAGDDGREGAGEEEGEDGRGAAVAAAGGSSGSDQLQLQQVGGSQGGQRGPGAQGGEGAQQVVRYGGGGSGVGREGGWPRAAWFVRGLGRHAVEELSECPVKVGATWWGARVVRSGCEPTVRGCILRASPECGNAESLVVCYGAGAVGSCASMNLTSACLCSPCPLQKSYVPLGQFIRKVRSGSCVRVLLQQGGS